MQKRTSRNIEFLVFDSLAEEKHIAHGVSLWRQSAGKTFDFSPNDKQTARRHRREFCEALDLDPDHLTILRQVHGATVHIITTDNELQATSDKDSVPTLASPSAPATSGSVIPANDRGESPTASLRAIRTADAVCTNLVNHPMMLFGADCPLLILYDPEAPAVGLAHAGWKPTVGRVTQRLLETMVTHLGAQPSRIRAGIGPAICANCYEVGPEVIAAVWENLADLEPESLIRPAGTEKQGKLEEGKGYFDLVEANVRQLTASGGGDGGSGGAGGGGGGGVPRASIEISGICTYESPRFPSYRRDGERAGRWGLLAGLIQKVGRKETEAGNKQRAGKRNGG